ncbi:MAG: hypothetical protein ACP5JS_05260 [Fervidobacterium sp.]
MKKALFVTSAIVLMLVVASCALLEKQPKSVTVDGTLTDWEGYLYTDNANDSQWGGNNEIYQAGIRFDEKNLYIAGVFTKENMNNLMVMVDLSGVTGASDTSNHPWNRKYKFENGDVDFVLETWGDGYTAWTFTASEATEATGTFANTTTEDGKKIVEFAIPLSKLGVTNAVGLSVKAVFVITGGFDQGTQWAGDFYPDQGFETGSGGYEAPIVIKNVVTYPTQK